MTFLSLKPLIASIASAHGYDAALLAAQASAESGFNPQAVSPAGAKGLMQFMDATWSEWGLGRDPFDASASLDAGVRYMKSLIARYSGAAEPVSLALAAYNAGMGNVDKAIKATGRTDWAGIQDHLPAETRAYVPKILGRAAVYKAAFVAGAVGLGTAGIALLAFLAVAMLRRILA
ncbi:MAG TPA: lytic transglycosylase domain-containing protein [Holophagaceae bacterium]